MPTLLLADDSELIRKTIKRILANEPTIEILGETQNFAETMQKTNELKPDVLLLDLHMPDEGVFDAARIKASLRSNSGIKIIGISLSGNDDDETRELAASLGASTVVEKARFYQQLIPAILSAK
jgi:DNA-binding NarL/FixJ family response regulator